MGNGLVRQRDHQTSLHQSCALQIFRTYGHSKYGAARRQTGNLYIEVVQIGIQPFLSRANFFQVKLVIHDSPSLFLFSAMTHQS